MLSKKKKKTNNKKWKWPTVWEKNIGYLSIANIYQVLSILDKLLVSRIYKEFWQQNNKKTNNLIF